MEYVMERTTGIFHASTQLLMLQVLDRSDIHFIQLFESNILFAV